MMQAVESNTQTQPNEAVIAEANQGASLESILSGAKEAETKQKTEKSQVATEEKPKDKPKAPPKTTEAEEKESQPQKPTTVDADKRVKEALQWGHGLTRKIKGFEQKIAQYVKDDVLTEDEAKALQEDLKHEVLEPETNHHQHPLMQALNAYTKIWDSEIDNMRKYSNDPDIDAHVAAFQHLLSYGDKEDIEAAFGAFDMVKDDAIALTRKMLEFGKQYHTDIYGELAKAGSLKAYKSQYEKKLAQQQKKIDKLEKEILQYEQNMDYLPSKSYSLPDGTTSAVQDDTDTTLNGIFERSRAGKW